MTTPEGARIADTAPGDDGVMCGGLVAPIEDKTRALEDEVFEYRKRAAVAEAEAGRLRFALAALVAVIYDGPMP